MSQQHYDVAVIGAGPGGYVSAIRCAQLGLKTVLIEKRSTLGGTCLNVGCIPSKALLDSSEHYHQALHGFKNHGIEVEGLKLDFGRMIERKREVVTTICQGVAGLMKKNKIDVIQGSASFVSANTLEIQGEQAQTIEAARIIIATGSEPSTLPGIELDGDRIITSTEALELSEVPGELLVIGGGAIGLEMGSVYARLGSKVTVIEFMDKIIPTMDGECGKQLQRSLKKIGMDFQLGFGVQGAKIQDGKVVVWGADRNSQASKEFTGDKLLVAAGRRPYTANLGLEKIGIELDNRGRIPVDHHCQTKVPNVYAIGDVIEGPMLAHKAEEEGVAVAELIAGQPFHVNHALIPGVVYTWPEVAGVGQTEEQLKAAGKAYKSGSFPIKALGRARAADENDGFVKILADAETDEVLGVHMMGPRVADLIAEAVIAMEYRASAEDIARTCHAHPTYAEAVKEAALQATAKRAIHM